MSDQNTQTEETRCLILRHAGDLFAHYGYAKTNIGDIAKACCMSPGNLYRYFRNKQAIGEETVRSYMLAEEAAMEATAQHSADDFEEKLRRMIHHGVGSLMNELRQNPKLVELADMICQSDSDILRRHIEWKRAYIERLLREGQEIGHLSIDDPAAMSSVILNATKAYWMPMALAQMDFEAVPAQLDAVLDLLLKGLRK